MNAVGKGALPLRQWLVVLVGLGLIWWLAISEMTGTAIVKDAGENLQLGLNLAHHGIFSLDASPPYRPAMTREPVPVAVLAATITVSDGALERVPGDAYFSGERARYLKFSNLLWLTLLTGCTFIAIRHFTAMFSLAVLGSAIVASHFTWAVPLAARSQLGVDNLDTELAGAALLTAASLLLVIGLARHSRLTLFAAGLGLGLAALTKASVFYVCLVEFAAFLAGYGVMVARRQASNWRPVFALFGALVAGFMLTTLPWLYRNHLRTGYWQIAERSGSVLMHRALLNEMTAQEFAGAWVVWGPPYLHRIVGPLTRYTAADLDAGGRLQRLAESFSGVANERELAAEDAGRPDQAVSWYRKARALYEANLAEFTRERYFYPSGAADRATRTEAARRIVAHPLKHAALMPLLIWRGAPLTFPVLLLAAVLAWRRGRPDLLPFVLPAVGLAVFYSAASQFPPRFAEVFYPIAVVAFLTAVVLTGWSTSRGTSQSECHAPI